MSIFTPAEKVYLQSQRLGRLATVGPDGQPHVVPVGFRYPEMFRIKPKRIISWGIEGEGSPANARSVA
jgi:hypothetical protein